MGARHTLLSIGPASALMLGLMLASSAHAIRFNASAVLAPAVTLTDNVCLSQNNKQWDYIGLMTPSGSLSAKSRKSSISVNGSVQLNTLTEDQLEKNDCGGGLGSRRPFSPRFGGSAATTLIDNWLKLNASARIDEREFSSAFRGGDDDLNRTGNRYQYYRYSITPTLSHRIGNLGSGTLRYTYDQLINSESLVADSTRNGLTANFNARGFKDISWGIGGRATRIEYEDTAIRQGRAIELKSANAKLGYKFTRYWQANMTGGYDFTQVSRSNGGLYWTLGMRFSPSRRTSFSISSGDRYFGKTPRMNITHTRKRNTFNASYKKSVTFARELRSNLEDGNFIDPDLGSSILSQRPILEERFTLGYSYGGRYATLGLNVYVSEQTRDSALNEFDFEGETSRFQGVTLSYSPIVSSRYNLSTHLGWDKDEPRASVGADDLEISNNSETWRAGLQLSRQFGGNVGVGLSYDFTDRQSDLEVGSYQENRVTATLSIGF